MHSLARFACGCIALVSALLLQGCEEEASQNNNGKSCAVDSVIASGNTSTGNPISVSWQKTFPYDDPRDVITVCDQCCADIKRLLLSSGDYTLLCAQAAQLEESTLYRTCQAECPSIELPPPNIDALCQPCAAGRYSTSGRGACDQCAAGRYIADVGATSCIGCPHGKYGISLGAASEKSSCLDCAPGTSSYLMGSPITGAASCENCAAGRWRTSGMGLCSACPQGTWSSALGVAAQSSCVQCGAGRYGNVSAATSISSCFECHAGTWSDSIGASSHETCTPCVAGRWSDGIGQISDGTCTACGLGTWSSTVGASDAFACTHCERGRWSSGAALATNDCTACLTGRYNDQLGSSDINSCKMCLAGSFGASLAMSECAHCQPGSFSASDGATGCSACLAGYFQTGSAATGCFDCPGGTASTTVGATAREHCIDCTRGSYSLNASTSCTMCEAGRYSLSAAVTACLSCPSGSVTQAGAFSCCPIDNENYWPIKSQQTLSVPPGKYWAKIYLVPDCETTKPPDPIAINTQLPEATMARHSRKIAVATLKQNKLHTCFDAKCQHDSCEVEFGVLPAQTELLMPGKIVKIGAFIRTHGTSSLQQCQETVEVGFVGYGCEEGTIVAFLLSLVIVVSLTMLLGLAFEQCFRLRIDHYVETSLKVIPTQASKSASGSSVLPACPTLLDLQSDLQYALHKNAPPAPSSKKNGSDWKLKKMGCWKIHGNEKTPVAFQVDVKTLCPLAQIDELRKFFQNARWATGSGWKSKDLQIEAQQPAVVKEAAKLPGADLMEAAEVAAVACFSCGRSRGVQPHARLELHSKIARTVLKSLMTRWALKVIVVQAFGNITMIIVLPILAYRTMTCADGFPWYIHVIWGLYLLTSSALATWLLLKDALRNEQTRAFFSTYRIRVGLRYCAMFISISDLYQDATFPVISGRCGFDLWWVALWLCFLGIGVMQVLVQLILLCKLYRRYHRVNSPEERERIHIEAIFMALRACDNHVVVHAIKPAVEEHLGGGSSWTMKLMEARVAFLRFVFEDAEQSALQASFLLFFDQATTFDKVWVGFSTGTSLLLSFALTVQTLPEVRDWLWFQFLSSFPLADRFAEVRILWLLLLIVIYRLVSLFPWLGSCTPAGDHDDSTAARLSIFFSDKSIPDHIKEDAFLGSLYAFLIACFMMALFLLAWRRQLMLPQRLFFRFCCPPPQGLENKASLVNIPPHDFGNRVARKSSMSVETVHDSDTWLESLRVLHAMANIANADHEKTLFATLDEKVFLLVHAICLIDMPSFDPVRTTYVDDCLKQLERAKLPADSSLAMPGMPVKTSADLLKTMRQEVNYSLDVARVRGGVLQLLKSRTFQQAGLEQKAQAISEVTEKKAPFCLLHWSVLRDAGKLPKFGDDPGAVDVPTIIARHAPRDVAIVYFSHIWDRQDRPDTFDNDKARNLVRFAQWLQLRAKAMNLKCEVYFWIDYCCMDTGSDISFQALPLYIAASNQILTWKTVDYDRHSWPMLERLLAYTFCQGGLTPFAVNALSFEVNVKKADAPDADVDSDSDDGDKGRTVRATKVVPASSAEEMDLSHVRVNHLVKKLPNPIDPVACRQTFLAAAIVQRRRVKQLVDVATAVPALEVFADRQPVDFGLTEVVEQFLGPFARLKPGDARSGADEDWLRVTEVRKVSTTGTSDSGLKAEAEWHLEVRLADGDVPRPLRGMGKEESTIVVMDRAGDDATTGVAFSPAEISALFDAVDVSFANSSAELDTNACKLAEALKADLKVAMDANDEKSLMEALQRARDVELPTRAKATRMLCKLQIANAQATGDSHALKMALRFALQNGLESLPEYIAGKKDISRLKKEALKEHALSVISKDKPDLEAIVSVIEMAQRRGWDDVVKQAVDALVIGVGASDTDGLRRLANIHRIASERKIHVVLSHTMKAFSTALEKAMEEKNGPSLVKILQYASDAGIDDVANDATNALMGLCEEWKTSWKEGDAESKGKARTELASLRNASPEGEVPTLHEMIDAAIKECNTFEDQERQRVDSLLKGGVSAGGVSAEALLTAGEIAKLWGWTKTANRIQEMWQERLDEGMRAGKATGVAMLMKLQNGASDHNLDDLRSLTSTAIYKSINAVTVAQDVAALLEMAVELDESGGHDFAADARKALREVVQKLKASDSSESQRALEQLKKTATEYHDDDMLDLAEGAIGTAVARETEQKATLQAQLKSAQDASELFKVFVAANSKGWIDLKREAKEKLHARVRKALNEGVAGMTEIAQLQKTAKECSDREITKLAGGALKDRVRKAKIEQDAATLLRIASATATEKVTDISKEAQDALETITKEWKKKGCDEISDSVENYVKAAQELGDDAATSFGTKLIDLASRCRDAKKGSAPSELAEISRDAKAEGFSGIEKDAQKTILDMVDKLKDKQDLEGLRSLHDATKRCGIAKIADKILGFVDIGDRIITAKAANDTKAMLDIVCEAGDLQWTSLAREGRSFLQDTIRELQRKVATKEGRKALLDLHDSARRAGLDDIADDAVDAVGGELPSNWSVHSADGKKAGFMLKKVAAKDRGLIDRIQQLVDATFMGWGSMGPDCCTRDRIKTKNPLSTRLKVEEVIHVENTENYLCFQARRQEIAQQIGALPVGTLTNDYHGANPDDWNIKTRQVSLKGVTHHPEEPVDKSLNECWLWHGTSEAGVVGITDTDFDMARAGSATGSMFGRGLYFAESVLKADEYAQKDARGWAPLLLCRVVLGRVHYCDNPKPWELQTELEESVGKGGFHAVMGDREICRGTFREFIVFDNNQVYPEYIVWYSRTPPMKKEYPP